MFQAQATPSSQAAVCSASVLVCVQQWRSQRRRPRLEASAFLTGEEYSLQKDAVVDPNLFPERNHTHVIGASKHNVAESISVVDFTSSLACGRLASTQLSTSAALRQLWKDVKETDVVKVYQFYGHTMSLWGHSSPLSNFTCRRRIQRCDA